MKNNTIIVILFVIIIGLGAYFLFNNSNTNVPKVQDTTTTTTTTQTTGQTTNTTVTAVDTTQSVIGKSVEGRNIIAYHFGTGDRELLLVGGIHGGYSWNTALLAYETMNYLKANPSVIPANMKVTIIPVLNPDGLYKVIGKEGPFTAADVSSSQAVQIAGRLNANKVDLSRNFDCNWQTSAKWQNTTESGGSTVFSEPESLAIKNYVETQKPQGVLVWYSSAGGVYASNCGSGVLPQTKTITDLFAKASGYPAYDTFDAYATTGDIVNWLAKIKIPAISVLLTNHTGTELTKNQSGIVSLLQYFSK
jgi:hypothetical protein